MKNTLNLIVKLFCFITLSIFLNSCASHYHYKPNVDKAEYAKKDAEKSAILDNSNYLVVQNKDQMMKLFEVSFDEKSGFISGNLLPVQGLPLDQYNQILDKTKNGKIKRIEGREEEQANNQVHFHLVKDFDTKKEVTFNLNDVYLVSTTEPTLFGPVANTQVLGLHKKGIYFSWGMSTGLISAFYKVQSNYSGNYEDNIAYIAFGLNLNAGYRMNDKWELGLLTKVSTKPSLNESLYNTLLGANCSFYTEDRLSYGLAGGVNLFSDQYDSEKGLFLGLITNYSLKRKKENKKSQFGINGGVYFSKFQPNSDNQGDPYYREWKLTSFMIDFGIYWRWK